MLAIYIYTTFNCVYNSELIIYSVSCQRVQLASPKFMPARLKVGTRDYNLIPPHAVIYFLPCTCSDSCDDSSGCGRCKVKNDRALRH
jgi:hypothetical protein